MFKKFAGGDMRKGPEVCTLRGRIRKCKIKCWPVNCQNYQACEQYPISTQALFARNGIPLYILERELRDEGWILESESLLELLMDEKNLSRGLVDNSKLSFKNNIGIVELDPNTD